MDRGFLNTDVPEQVVGDNFSRVLLCAAVIALTGSAFAQDCCTPCDSALKGTCFDDSQQSCCNGDTRHSSGCLRCRKTLLHWPCQEVSYASPDDEEEPLATDRPDFTEASSVVGLGRTQFEFGYTYIRDEEGGIEFDGHSYPEILARIGMLAEWFEFRLAWNYAQERTRVAGIGDTVDGAEDLYLGCKLAMFEQEGWWPELAIVPQMTVPTGAAAFTTDDVMPGMNVLYGWDVIENLTFAGSTQGNRALDDTGDFYDEYAQSLTVGVSLTEQLGMYNEVFGIFPHGAVDAPTEYYYNGGFTYRVNYDLQFDIRAGWGLNDRSDDFFAGIGGAQRF
jgi:hypothetical protein